MKSSSLVFLKGMAKYYWYMSIIFYLLLFLIPLILPSLITSDGSRFSFWEKRSVNTFIVNNTWSQILLFVSMANYMWIIIAFKDFIQVLNNFEKNIIFEKSTQILLKKIGKYLSTCSSIFFIIEIILMFINWERHTSMITLYAFILLIGQFFYVLAELFKKARKIKTENDLTI